MTIETFFCLQTMHYWAIYPQRFKYVTVYTRCPVVLSVAVTKGTWGRNGLHLLWGYTHKGKPGDNQGRNLEAEIEAEAVKEWDWLAPRDLLSLLSYILRINRPTQWGHLLNQVYIYIETLGYVELTKHQPGH